MDGLRLRLADTAAAVSPDGAVGVLLASMLAACLVAAVDAVGDEGRTRRKIR